MYLMAHKNSLKNEIQQKKKQTKALNASSEVEYKKLPYSLLANIYSLFLFNYEYAKADKQQQQEGTTATTTSQKRGHYKIKM